MSYLKKFHVLLQFFIKGREEVIRARYEFSRHNSVRSGHLHSVGRFLVENEDGLVGFGVRSCTLKAISLILDFLGSSCRVDVLILISLNGILG